MPNRVRTRRKPKVRICLKVFWGKQYREKKCVDLLLVLLSVDADL